MSRKTRNAKPEPDVSRFEELISCNNNQEVPFVAGTLASGRHLQEESRSTRDQATSNAQSLATAISGLASQFPDSTAGSSSGTTAATPNSFWTALAQKAQASADFIATTKTAERYYYGSTPWADYVNGAVIDHSFGSKGILDARRDFEVDSAAAAATLNKGLQSQVSQRDLKFADATLQLAKARSSYETGWAALNVDSSGFVLSTPGLPIGGANDGTITVTANVGTQFVPGAFSVPPATTTVSTSTGFSTSSIGSFTSGGYLPETKKTDSVMKGAIAAEASGVPGTLGGQSGTGGQTTPTVPVPDAGDSPAYDPPETNYVPMELLPPGVLIISDGDSTSELSGKPKAPGELSFSLPEQRLKIFGQDNPGLGTPFDMTASPFERSQTLQSPPLDGGLLAEGASTIIIIIDESGIVSPNSDGLLNAELGVNDIEMAALEAEAESLIEEATQVAGEVALESLFKPVLKPGEVATYDWTKVQEDYLQRYGQEGIGLLMMMTERGWTMREANYWSDWSWSNDFWIDSTKNSIYINRGDWFNTTSRSEWNVAGQLHEPL